MRELIKQLNQFYIPPLSKLYFERMALEKIVFRSPLFVRISDPDSWLIQSAYSRLKTFDSEQLATAINNIISYLATADGGVVFEGNRALTLNDSVPYIEWEDNENFYALTDFLGKYSLFIDANEFEGEWDSLTKIIQGLQASLGDVLQFFLINASESTEKIITNGDFTLIRPQKVTTLSFMERFNFKSRSRNGLALFNFGSKPYFMMSPNGKLVTFFGKQDQSALIEEIKNIVQQKD